MTISEHRPPAVERGRATPPVVLDEYGLLRSGAAWVALSIAEWRLMQPLVGRFGSVVTVDDLIAAVWAGHRPSVGALHVLVRRTRHRIAPLGLDLTNMRGRGYMLDHARNRATVALAAP